METRRTSKRDVFLLLLLTMLLATMAGCAAPAEATQVPQAEKEGEIERIVEVRAEGLTLHYLRQSFWGEESFSNYLADQARFKADFKEHFEPALTRNGVSPSDYQFSFDSTNYSTILQQLSPLNSRSQLSTAMLMFGGLSNLERSEGETYYCL